MASEYFMYNILFNLVFSISNWTTFYCSSKEESVANLEKCLGRMDCMNECVQMPVWFVLVTEVPTRNLNLGYWHCKHFIV